MGIRYRKSIKICKGVRMNISKSGASYTFGGRGASINTGRNGTYLNTGIPGTGIYSRERLDTPAHQPTPSYNTQPGEVQIIMNDRGHVELYDASGHPITDQARIRRIKSGAQYGAAMRAMETQRRQKLGDIMRDQAAASDNLIRIYKHAPKVETEAVFWDNLQNMQPEPYTRRQFETPAPDAQRMKDDLKMEAYKNVKTRAFWRRKKLWADYVQTHFDQEYPAAQALWEKEKRDFEDEETLRAQDEARRRQAECQAQRQQLQSLGEGDPEAVEQTVGRWLGDMSLPVDVSVNYTYDADIGALLLDVDLPEIESLPTTQYVQLQSGNLTERKKTQTQLREEYATLIFGIAVFLAANLFNLSPAITGIVLSGYSQRRNAAGDVQDDYLLSVCFTRAPFEKECAGDCDPIEFCQRFENRCKMTATKIFKPIEPYTD